MKGFGLLKKWLILKHSSSQHPNYQCWARDSKGKSFPHLFTHHATNATWNKWVSLITKWGLIGNPNFSWILETTTNLCDGENFRLSEKEEKKMTGPPYNLLPENKKWHSLNSWFLPHCKGYIENGKLLYAVLTQWVTQATKGQDGSSTSTVTRG